MTQERDDYMRRQEADHALLGMRDPLHAQRYGRALRPLPSQSIPPGDTTSLDADVMQFVEALRPFVRHWHPWMDETDATEDGSYNHPDSDEMSTFARITYGDLRRARTYLASIQGSQGREAEAISTASEGDGIAAGDAGAPKYRKTALIEAVQWWKMGDHSAVILKSDPNRYADEGIPWCPTLEGGHVVTPGDWIATGIQGEHWPIKADVFAATYELAPPKVASDTAPEKDIEIANLAVKKNINPDGSVMWDSAQGYACALEAVRLTRAALSASPSDSKDKP